MDDAAHRLARLVGYLEQDLENLPLIADAAAAAMDAGELAITRRLIERYMSLAPLPSTLQNLDGLAALRCGDLARAAAVFETLLAAEPGQPQLGFNLALVRMKLRDWPVALGVLDSLGDPLATEAARLKVQVLHHLGRLDDALALGAAQAAAGPIDADLASALSVVAIDAGQTQAAYAYARRGGDRPEALATLGALRLADSQPAEAARWFDASLERDPDNARGHLGRGLCRLIGSDPRAAADLDRAAALFGDHLGSWVAAGWAWFVAGDPITSRARFETALALDDTFAETHGALAVLDVLAGEIEAGRRRAQVAGRLDPHCFGAALAKSLLAQQSGDAKTADKIRRIALNTPIGDDGRTIASTMAALGRVGRRH
jgi:tetratricopeptide (TPR) repeat protein